MCLGYKLIFVAKKYNNYELKSMVMSEKEMFEKSFQRPSNFFKLTTRRQWEIDKDLGIMDWMGHDLTPEDQERFNNHYK